MGSLTAHLRLAEDHGRLPFHPECPVCRRERLSGVLPSDGVLTRRAQAALVAGVLAASAGAPAAVSAQETDQQTEGSVAPEQIADDDRAQTPGFDPGGGSTDLPFEAPPAPQTGVAPADDSDPLEQEPVTDVAAPVADPGDDLGSADAPQLMPLATEMPATPPVQPRDSAPANTTPQADSAPDPPTAAPVQEPDRGTTPVKRRKPDRDRRSKENRPRDDHPVPWAKENRPRDHHPVPSAKENRPRDHHPVPSATHVVGPETLGTPSAPPPVAIAHVQAAPPPTATSADAATRGERLHVVERGESLWTIARDLLGEDASVAAIAREVNALWERNKTRIGTGDPDLLMVGTRLRLR
jgi:hypothetical protein